jgi:tRNA-specific 2-thiouridylase
VINLIDAYKDRVVRYLLEGYAEGVTPNPDVMCNREMKFGIFAEKARGLGAEFVATGHHVRRADNPDGTADILEGADANKDQSYFLALLRQDQIQRALFPIGHLQKPELRKIAADAGLPTADKKDSQGICFIGKVKMEDFLKAYLPEKPGPIVNTEGRLLGEHRGLHYYTLGQRKGIRVASNTPNVAYVVVAKKPGTDTLVVALERPGIEGLYSSESRLQSLSFCKRERREPCGLLARPRYRAKAVPVRFTPHEDGTASLAWAEPQRAIAPGQICALYEGNRLVGGGVFI